MRSSTTSVEDVRPICRTSPSTCRKIRYSSRSDTPAIMPNSWANADHRKPAGYATFWNPAGDVIICRWDPLLRVLYGHRRRDAAPWSFVGLGADVAGGLELVVEGDEFTD